MKTNKLKLDKIESLGRGVQLAHIILEIDLGEYCESVQLSSIGMMLRVESNLLTSQIYHLMKWFDKKEKNEVTNQQKCIKITKEMIEADQKLKKIESI